MSKLKDDLVFLKSKLKYYALLRKTVYLVDQKEDKDDVEKREEVYYKIFANSASTNIEVRLRHLQELKSNL